MTEEIKHKKRKFLFNPLRRPLPYMGLMLGLLLIIFQETIRNYVSDSLGNIMVSAMDEATDSKYKITYDLVRFDVISKELRISNLSVYLDTTVNTKEHYLHEKPNLINIKAPLVIVKLRSILPLLFKNQLYVSYIGAKNPHVSLIRSKHNSVTKEASQASRTNLLEAINNYFTALEIDSFRVESGSFNVSSHFENDKEIDLIYVGKFTTILEKFRLDSLSPSILLSGFNATNAEIEISNQEINIPETGQHIHFKRLYLSTSDSTITLDSLLISQSPFDSINNKPELKIAQLKIEGINFDKANHHNEIFIDKIKINQPKIYLTENNFNRLKQQKSDSIFSKSFYHYFKQLHINDITLFNGALTVNSKRETQINNFSTHVSNYSINPIDWKNKKLFSEIFINSFEASNVTQELPDSIHITQIKKVKYSEFTKTINLDNVKISPISGRNSYKNLQSRNINYSAYSNIKNIKATGFDPKLLVQNKPIKIDSLFFNQPKISILQYPNMRLNSIEQIKQLPFSIQYVATQNGSLKLRQNQSKESKLTLLEGISFQTNNLTERSNFTSSPLNLAIKNGSFELKEIGHTVVFNNLTSNNSDQLFVKNVAILPDSVTLPFNQINAKIDDAVLIGYDLKSLKNQEFSIDTVSIGKININGDFTRTPFISYLKNNKNAIKKIRVNDFSLGKSSINLSLNNSKISVNDVAISTQNIVIDSIQQTSINNFSTNNLLLDFGKFDLENKIDSSKIKGLSGGFSDKDSIFFLQEIQYISQLKNIRASLEVVKVNGVDKTQLKENRILKFQDASLHKPIFEFISQKNSYDSSFLINNTQPILTTGLHGIQFNSVEIAQGYSKIRIPSINKEIEIKRIDGIVFNTNIDTTTTIYETIDHFKGTFRMHNINMTGLKDTLIISKLSIDTDARNIWSESFTYNTILYKNKLKLESPGIAIRYINIPNLLKQQITINQLSSRNNFLYITQTDSLLKSSKLKLSEISIPYNVNINGININNTTLVYNAPIQHKSLLNNIEFDIEIDSLSAQKEQTQSLATLAKDFRIRTYGLAFNLPDSLNKASFDTLLISTKNASVSVTNLKLTPLYSKKEYGIKAGFQADWKNLLIEKVRFEKLNFIDLIENNTFNCQKLSINNGYLDLYKDKQLVFPSERILPMEQDFIRNFKTKLKLDTIEINHINISQTTLESLGKTEGSISFINTTGTITNITNDSLRLLNNKIMEVHATSKIMNKGLLTAHFTFDLKDTNNLFFFDAKLAPMKAEEFNNILEATALVSVTSGKIKSATLKATGNSSYAYGNMSFLYSNLKVETINKKSLESKGMGKVLKTFFANTFVVKKNNSKYKLLSRRGEMYYERDPARITLDYAAKTALTGVVSSIGARNNRKEIKQIKKENKELREHELKYKKEQEKSAKNNK